MKALQQAYDSDSPTSDNDEPSSSLVSQEQLKVGTDSTPTNQDGIATTSIPQQGHSALGGYVSKRKRRSQGSSDRAEGDSSSRSSTVSQYLSSMQRQSTAVTKRSRTINHLPHLCETIQSNKHTKPVLSLQWHQIDPCLLLSSSLDGTVKLWDATRPSKCIATYVFHNSAAVRKSCWNTSNSIISGGYDHMASHSDIETSQVLSQLKHKGYVTAIACHPSDSNIVVTGDSERNVSQWDLRTGKCTTHYKGAEGKVLDVIFLQNGKEFVTSTDVRRNAFGRAINVWDLSGGVIISHQLYVEPYTCPCLRLHPRDSVFLAQSNGNYVILFSSTAPYKLNKHKRFEGHTVQGYDVGFDVSPDGTMVCSASSNGQIKFYEFKSSRVLTTMSLSQSPCLAVAWNPALPSTVAVSDWKGVLFVAQ